MKRLLVIAAFVVVVLGALGGGAYYFMQGETASPRKPVVAKEAALEPEVVRDNSGGPLGTDRENPASTVVDDGTEGRIEPDRPVQPDKSPDKPDRTPVKPDGTAPDSADTRTKPDATDTPTQPEIVPTEGLTTLAGRVVDDVGEPVSGASVMLNYNVPVTRESRGRTPRGIQKVSVASTDNDGFYRAEVKLVFPSADGELEVQMWAEAGNGLNSGPEPTVRVKLGGTHENIDFTLARGGDLTGELINHRFEPLAGATVFAQWTDGQRIDKALQTKTDENGSFAFSGLKPGTYQVFGTMDGYQPDGEISTVEVTSGQATAMPGPVKMKPFTALKVKLTCPDGQPRGIFKATFYNADGKTSQISASADVDGNALISGVPEDAVEMVIEMHSFQTTERIAISVVKDDHMDIGEIGLIKDAPQGD